MAGKLQGVGSIHHSLQRDMTMEYLESRWGAAGYCLYWRLRETLADTPDHRLNLASFEALAAFAVRCHADPDSVLEMLTALAELGVVDRELWAEKTVWCQALVDEFSRVYQRRGRRVPPRPDPRGEQMNLFSPAPGEVIHRVAHPGTSCAILRHPAGPASPPYVSPSSSPPGKAKAKTPACPAGQSAVASNGQERTAFRLPGGHAISWPLWQQVLNRCGKDREQAARVFFRASRQARASPVGWIMAGLEQGYALLGIREEDDRPAYVKAWCRSVVLRESEEPRWSTGRLEAVGEMVEKLVR